MNTMYRSILNVDPDEPLIDTVAEHLHRWIATKSVHVPSEAPGRYLLSPEDMITVLRENVDGKRVFRWHRERPFDRRDPELMTTTVTAVEDPDGRGWLWTQVQPPSSHSRTPRGKGFMCVPSFVRSMLGSLACFDGQTPILADPQWISTGHLPDLMDFLADDTRRGPILVVSPSITGPSAIEGATALTFRELIGIGTMFLLEEDAEEDFNTMMGPDHALLPGTIRTYAPGVNLDEPDDPARHPTLGRRRIETKSVGQLAYLLGLCQRRLTCSAPIPPYLDEIDQALMDAESRMEQTVASVHLFPTPNGRVPGQRTGRPHGPGVPSAPTLTARDARARLRPGGHYPPFLRVLDEPIPFHHDDERTIEDLHAENDMIRRQIEMFTTMVQAYEQCQTNIREAVETFGEQMRRLRSQIDNVASGGGSASG
ncbi:hypothetical protein [Phytoactinopolyspora halotolerans]|uniref:Uncharacterized protein n=1 Tax=Phytoactinopolyspora halotolerans TaxID=1981512 RepID=A0A6L9SH35_9ACTN|nr:hypothetical protein [Phytoactinopolyspora halotolerans]NEE03928.1 hypothetical protein [Phytoactinopolyspora halotolerans]